MGGINTQPLYLVSECHGDLSTPRDRMPVLRRNMRRNLTPCTALVLSFLVLTGVATRAAEEIVELRLQCAKCLCGVVLYPNNDPVSGAKVEELGEGWKGFATINLRR